MTRGSERARLSSQSDETVPAGLLNEFPALPAKSSHSGSQRSTVIALDAGTSSVKAVLARVDARGCELLSEAVCAHAPPTGHAGVAEQDALSWWASAVSAVNSLQGDVGCAAALSLSGQMQSVVLVDQQGMPLSEPLAAPLAPAIECWQATAYHYPRCRSCSALLR